MILAPASIRPYLEPMRRFAPFILAAGWALTCSSPAPAQGDSTMLITSTAFAEGENIPSRFTCDGDDLSPALAWTGVPEAAQSLVLICDDPDAPMGTWDHWVMFNIPASVTGLPEITGGQDLKDQGIVEATNSWSRTGYGGPCPPSGTHRYYFKLYALDGELSLNSTATKQDVEQAMGGHILDQTQLMGRYSR